MRRGRLGWVLLALAAVLLLPSCSRRPQPSRSDEIWLHVDLRADGAAEVEVWVEGGEEKVLDVTGVVSPRLFPGGVVTSVTAVEDEESELHGVVAVVAAFRPGPEVVAGFDLDELSSELGRRGYDRGSLTLCWPDDGPVSLLAEPQPAGVYDTCAYWDRFPVPVDATLVSEPKPERWLVRVPLTLLTGALPVVAMVALRRSRRRPGGAKKALRWSLVSFGALVALFASPPIGDPGTSLALSGIAGRAAATVATVTWWVLFAFWAFLLYFIAPLLLLIALYERRRERKLARAPMPPASPR